MSSTQLSQMPLLILPVQNLKKLQSPKPTAAIPTKSFNEKTLNEFRKTAATVEKSPFDLVEGSNYLRSLCDRSEKGEHPPPMPLSLYELRLDDFQCHEELERAGAVDGFHNFAPGTPKRMEVHAARPNFPKDNANGPVCVPEAVPAASATPAQAMVLDDDEDEVVGAAAAADPTASAPAPKGPKTTRASLWGQQPGHGKDAFFGEPRPKAKAKAKAKVIKTAVKSAAKPGAKKKATAKAKANGGAAGQGPEPASEPASKPAAKAKSAATKAKAKAKSEKPKPASKAKAKASAKAKSSSSTSKVKPGTGNQKVYPTRPGYQGCSKCRRSGCAACKLVDDD